MKVFLNLNNMIRDDIKSIKNIDFVKSTSLRLSLGMCGMDSPYKYFHGSDILYYLRKKLETQAKLLKTVWLERNSEMNYDPCMPVGRERTQIGRAHV